MKKVQIFVKYDYVKQSKKTLREDGSLDYVYIVGCIDYSFGEETDSVNIKVFDDIEDAAKEILTMIGWYSLKGEYDLVIIPPLEKIKEYLPEEVLKHLK